MSNLIYATTSTDRTVPQAVIEAAHVHGMGWTAVEDPVTGRLTYRRLLQASAILGAKLMPLALEGPLSASCCPPPTARWWLCSA
jgi:acyl-[acyl-carrier-protein]-phospholipid O-acyltransferase/long-chain-fatty-acid--[acyl-carrier-protein] ligase